MASDQRFSLKWNNYQTHLVTAFESLLGESDFVDVTLGVEGRKLSAHKMLLSACSPYFRDLFKGNPCQHPIIVLRDIRYSDLYSLLQFMYNGEVNVAQDQLNSFLKSAESLKIRGLTDNEDSEVTKDITASGSGAVSSRKKRSATDASSVQQPPLKRLSAAQPSHVKDIEPVKQEVIDINDQDEQYVDEPEVGYEEGGGGPPQAVDQYGEAYADGALAIPDDGTVDQHTDTQGWSTTGPNPDGQGIGCEVCGKVFAWKSSLYHHMRSHTGQTSCEICGKVMSRKAHLKVHMRTHADQIPFQG